MQSAWLTTAPNICSGVRWDTDFSYTRGLMVQLFGGGWPPPTLDKRAGFCWRLSEVRPELRPDGHQSNNLLNTSHRKSKLHFVVPTRLCICKSEYDKHAWKPRCNNYSSMINSEVQILYDVIRSSILKYTLWHIVKQIVPTSIAYIALWIFKIWIQNHKWICHKS